MTTAEIIKQMEKELYEFIASSPPNYPSVWKSLIRSRLRTLLESFGEEIIKTRYKCGWRHDEEGAEYDLCDECRAVDEYKAEQRLKVKEIIKNIT